MIKILILSEDLCWWIMDDFIFFFLINYILKFYTCLLDDLIHNGAFKYHPSCVSTPRDRVFGLNLVSEPWLYLHFEVSQASLI